MRANVFFVGLCFCLSASTVAEAQLNRYEYQQIEMGVSFRIVLYACDEASANQAAKAAYTRINKLNHILSDYDRDSELMRLCKTSLPGKPVATSPELRFVLCRALALSRRTQGAFDVTVGPVVQLWRRTRRRKQLPNPDRLAKARSRVGYQFVRLDEKNGTVELMKPNMRLDLGGIAKGYAADEALTVLKRHGITRALVDGSGDIVVGDPPPGKNGWRIKIASLNGRAGQPSRYLELSNAAVATSGDAFQHIEIDGTRYSHIIDPKTGLGLTTPSSVTVIAPDGITADSLASAVSVLGPKKGMRLIETIHATETLVVSADGMKHHTFSTSGFDSYSRTVRPR